MKKTILLFAALAMIASAAAQTPSSKSFKEQYERQVKMLGSTGIGVETILDRWAEAYPEDGDMLESRFNYYLLKSRTVQIVQKPVEKYLGVKPVLSLKDKEGKPVYYFEEATFVDSLFAMSTKNIDKAIKCHPNVIQYRFDKISALLAYEKESPDMCCAELLSLIDHNFTVKPDWTFTGGKVGEDVFASGIQEYCISFFNMATKGSFEAFRSVSERMVKYLPKNPTFLCNIGSYWLVAKENQKEAQKWYNKVLKIKPDDYTALKNSLLIAKTQKNAKAVAKYTTLLTKIEKK